MLGFIGTGNMATAIIKGVIASGMLSGEDIAVYDIAIQSECELKLCSSRNVYRILIDT